jgi:putative transposase
LVVKVRHEGRVINKAIHLALGVNLAGHKELLGLWMTTNESSNSPFAHFQKRPRNKAD